MLELERVAYSRAFRIGLESGGCRFAAPLGIPDRLERPLDAAVRIHGECDFGVAIAHRRVVSELLRTRSGVPPLKSGVISMNGERCIMHLPLPDIGGKDGLSLDRANLGGGGRDSGRA